MTSKQAATLLGEMFASYPSLYVTERQLAVWVRRLLPYDVDPVERAIALFVRDVRRRDVDWAHLREFIQVELTRDEEGRRLKNLRITDGPPATDEQRAEFLTRFKEACGVLDVNTPTEEATDA